MTDFDDLAEQYIAMWNETDPARRRRLVEEVLATGARYVDPLAAVEGHDAIEATVAAVQARFPGLTFRLAGPVDAHHGQARFTWTLGPAGEEPLVVGFDVAELGADGRIGTVLGFLDKVPA